MSDRPAPTVPMSEDLLEMVDAQLDYGDARAAWIREAVRDRLVREGAIDPSDAPAEN